MKIKEVTDRQTDMKINEYKYRGPIAVTRDRENFIQFVAIHDFTY